MTDELREDSYPAIHPAYVPVRNNDVVYVRAGPWSGPVVTIRNEPSSDDEKLFDLLDGKHTYADIVDRIGRPEAVENTLRKLGRQNVLYFLEEESNYPVTRIPLQENRPNVVETLPSDVQYALVTYGDIGGYVSDWLSEMNASFEHTNLSGASEVDDVELTGADFGIFLTDQFRPRATERFNERALDAEMPWVAGQVNGFDAIVGPTVIPGETACYRCYQERVESNIDDSLYKLYYEGSKQTETSSSFGPLGQLVESYICLELSHMAQFGQGITVERVLAVSATTMTTSMNDVLKVPRCDCRGQLQERKRFIGYEDVQDWGVRDAE